ncbi:MAG: type II secretion system F family protein [Calditrichaeota bacterium]|nr:type II secretion system F family protein [Calditrichota bacterium]
MEKYKFRARDLTGNVHKGIISAESLDDAVHSLREKNYYPVVLTRQRGNRLDKLSAGSAVRISSKELMLFCTQLATLLGAGVSLASALSTVTKQIKNLPFQKIVSHLENDVTQGHSFSAALSKYPKIFPPLLVNMIKAGEESGQLDKVLENYAHFQERKEAVKSEIKNAMMYPIFLVILSVGIMAFLLIYILPKFVSVLKESHAQLPVTTRIMIGSSEFLQHYYAHIFFGAIVFLLVGRQIIKTRSGRKMWDYLKLHLPIMGSLVYKMALVRFCNVFGVLIRSGVPILRSLGMAQNVVNNVIFENVLRQINSNLTMGKNLGDEVVRTRFFPPMFVQMVIVGEKTGRLDQMMMKIADYYNKEANHTLKRLVAALEPTMLVVMALLVGFIALSLVSALMSVLNTIK